MRTFAAVGLVTTALTFLSACDDDAAENGGNHDSWCADFDELMVTLNEVMIDSSTPPDPQSEAVQELDHMSEAFVELPVPEPIREDFDAALPRSLERPAPDEQVRARADVYGWIVENCELSDELDAELRRQVADDHEYLAGIPSTTG